MIDKVESIIIGKVIIETLKHFYRGADKFLTRTTSRCIMFNGENISFDASLAIYLSIYLHIYISIHLCVYLSVCPHIQSQIP